MLKLIWAAIVGAGPGGWLALGLGALVAFGAVFGAGYATGAQGTVATVVKAQGAAPAAAAKEQKAADDKDRERGREAGKVKDARDRELDAKLARLEAALAGLRGGTCPVPKAMIDILNEAGN